MNRLRVLILGSECNPEQVSIPLVTFSHAAALAKLHDVTLVARSANVESLHRANAPFRSIEVIRTPQLDRIFAWGFRRIFKSNFDRQALTAFRYPFAVAFEWYAWRQLRGRILAGEFDVVLRIVPLTAVLPSPFAFFLRNGPIPFVLGPLNGGLPWPSGFSQLKKQREWVSGLRKVYRILPFARSTFRLASAIIVASSQTYSEFARFSDKLFFVPENGIDPSICRGRSGGKDAGAPLELIFVGALVPRKACDLAIRAAAPLLRNNSARFTVVGDGPERKNLQELTISLGVERAVTFCGWLGHPEVLDRLQSADALVFPSVRDFGGGVVFEALASGTVPIVVDFGGPGDIVTPEIGCKVPLTDETDMAMRIQTILLELAVNRDLLNRLRVEGMAYARERLTWDAKAEITTRILNWAVGRDRKPDLVPPKLLYMKSASSS
jgi:glycosyltransferase involved in cell wall biosynthesis